MVKVVPVGETQLLLLSTYVASFNQTSPTREYYFSEDIEPLLLGVLSAFASGDKERLRSFCCALYCAFTRTFSRGLLTEIRSYWRDRLIRFTPEHGQLSHITIYQTSNNKEIAILGVDATYLLSETIGLYSLPQRPFSYQSKR